MGEDSIGTERGCGPGGGNRGRLRRDRRRTAPRSLGRFRFSLDCGDALSYCSFMQFRTENRFPLFLELL